MPGVVGYQADMAHSMLFTLGYNRREGPAAARRTTTGRTGQQLDAAYKKVADALRPWTLDFHVAQNDGTVFGSGDHEKTGRHCQVDGPERQARYRQARRLLAARRPGRPDQDDAPHLLGRLHVPERGDGGAADLERRSRRHGQGARRARLAGIGDQGTLALTSPLRGGRNRRSRFREGASSVPVCTPLPKLASRPSTSPRGGGWRRVL